MLNEPHRMRPPSRFILIVSLVYLSLALLAGLEALPGLHWLMVSTLLVLLAFMLFRQWVLFYLAARERPPPLPADGSEPPLVSVLLPAYNEAAVIQSSLRSLLALRYPQIEIIVIDDGSLDDTAERARQVAQESRLPVRVISQANRGKAGALNTGFIHASGAYVLVVDADSRVESDALQYGLRHFADARVGAVGGFVGVANTQKLLCRFQALEYLISLNFVRRALSRVGLVTVVPGPVGLFRREAILQVGGYKEDGATFAEDADITLRLLAAGWRVAGERSMVAYTEAPEDVYTLLRQRYRWRRGIYQAFADNMCGLITAPGRAGIPITLFIALEAFVLEVINFGFTLFFLAYFLRFGEINLLFSWYLVIVTMDVLTLLFISHGQGHFLRNLGLFFIQRFSYAFLLQAWNVIALVDEWRASAMSWDKLERLGRLEVEKT